MQQRRKIPYSTLQIISFVECSSSLYSNTPGRYVHQTCSKNCSKNPSKNRNERCFQAHFQKCSKTRLANDTQSSRGTFPEASVYTIPKESEQETEVQWLRTVLPRQMGKMTDRGG